MEIYPMLTPVLITLSIQANLWGNALTHFSVPWNGKLKTLHISYGDSHIFFYR